MNEEIKPSFWRKAWNEPRRFFFWLTLVALLPIGGAALESQQQEPAPGYIIGALIGAFSFILGFSGLILALIPWTRPLMNWVLRRRFFVLAGIITLIALFYAEENWRGKRAWDNYKAEQAAKGEYLDFARVIPPPVPDDQNFALTPLLKSVLDYRYTTNHVIWSDTNALARLRSASVDSLPLKKHDEKNYPNVGGGLFKGTLADMNQWQSYFQDNTNFPQAAASAGRAEKILFALGKFDAELSELQQAAAERPLSRFPVKYDEEPQWNILLPHLSDTKGLTRLASVRAIARLEAGREAGALADLKLALRLSASVKSEPILISHLVRLANLAIALDALREGLARHAWNDSQLAEIENQLADINLLDELKQSLRGERAFSVSGIDWLRRQGWKFDYSQMGFEDDSNQNRNSFVAVNFLPGSFYYFNMLTVAQTEALIFSGFDENIRRVFPDKAQQQDKALESLPRGFHPHTMFARMIVPALGRSLTKSARMQAYVDFARIACALERHRLAHNSYPASLDALAPKFISSLPLDIINGQPLHYRREGDSYKLYSVGWNERDDGGAIVFGKGETPPVDPNKGDWVWRYPAP